MVTRVLNHPELIFNSRPQQDHDRGVRFFQRDAQEKWALSLGCECLVCQRYQYSQIFYERGVMSKNQDLVEITDPEVLQELKY